ncbi:MAG TPA: phenylalanine--tRNA ligase subunit beta [Burkholderiales bacterium]|nr:phenylalanine--tRNA ligase subunit beta [Burkholderiales bacterium]
MKFSENWLRQFVDPPLTSEELAHALTMAGLEVEALESAAPPFTKVVVGEVVSVDRHPDADRLSVCQVNAGLVEALQIVCGAPNVKAGMRVPCALPGAELPGITIRTAKVRGVESWGMLCSARELGLSEESSGLLDLGPGAPVGADLREYLDLDDRLFTLKLTPNRADCLSVAGVAREVAAITTSSLRLDETAPVAAVVDDRLDVVVKDARACPLYCGRVLRGIRMDAVTPDWIVRRLERCGLRPINPVVDVTNYVMLELGQPLHAFDLARITRFVQVRFAAPGERLILLNGQTATLDGDMLVIADDSGPLALAGIMGGEPSAVSATTTDLFLESAFFDPGVIAGRGRRLGFATDSSHRFERGVDFGATRVALERATRLITGICGGRPGPLTEVKGVLPAREPIALRVERAQRLLGVRLDEAEIQMLLRRLHFSFAMEKGVFHVSPHSYRFDLAIEEDLIEELARIYGYDRIPARAPEGAAMMIPEPEAERPLDRLRQVLVARDYQEVVNYAFVEEQWESDFAANTAPVRLQNPIASQMSVMRSSLIGGLMGRLQHNLSHRQSRVRLFEAGACFARGETGYCESERLGGLCHGDALPEQWGSRPSRAADFYDAKGDVEALMWPAQARFEAARHPAFHPGKSARIMLNGEHAGFIGEIHPRWQQKYEIPQPVIVFELELSALTKGNVPGFSTVSRFPPVRRDLAVVVAEEVPVQAILDALWQARPATVVDLALFDLYRGKGVEQGKKSLAFRVLLQDTQKTLTDPEVDSAVAQLIRVLQDQFRAGLRS